MRFFLALTLIFSNISAVDAPEIQEIRPLLVEAIAETYPEYDTGNPTRLLGQVTPHLLSPDGTTLMAFADLRRPADTRQEDNLLCFYHLDEQDIVCYPQPFQYTIRTAPARVFAWSPDGKKVAFYEDYYEGRQESDIWLMDVATGDMTHLTDDGVSGSYTEALTNHLAFTIDYAPIWNPVNGDLYFIRLEGDSKIGLYKIASNQSTPELVSDLSEFRSFGLVDISPVSLAAVSPDGTQFVFAPLSFKEEKIGLWKIDLETGELSQFINVADLKAAMPAWLSSAARFVNIREVIWHDARIIVMVEILTFAINVMNYYAIDPTTGAITALLDFDPYETMDDFLRESLSTLLPRPVGIVSGDHFYLLHLERTETGISPIISAAPITFETALTKIADISPEEILYPLEYFPSTYKFLYTAKGRVLVGNYVLTFK